MKTRWRILFLLLAYGTNSADAVGPSSTVPPLQFERPWAVVGPLLDEPRAYRLEVTVIPAADPALRKADIFSVGGAGYGGRTTEAEDALAAICATPNATAKLMEVVRSASAAGQLYALLGLRFCDPVAYEGLLPAFTSRDDEVEVLMGCLGSTEQVGVVARRIARGSYDRSFARQLE